MKIFSIVVLGIALGVLLRAAQYFLSLATRQKTIHTYIQKWFPWIQVFMWTIYVFWVIHKIFLQTVMYNLLISATAILFLLFLSWYVFRDFIAGAVLRSGQPLEPGIRIATESFSGTIARLGFFNLEIITPEGERMKIPYHRLSSQGISWRSESGEGKSQVFRINIPQHLGALNIKREFTRKLLELPWVVAGAEIKIKMIPSGEIYETEISFYSIRDDMAASTGEIIRKHVEKLSAENQQGKEKETKKS